MTWILGLFVPGKRTVTFSIIAGLLAVIMQADTQGVLTLSPMIRLMVDLAFTLVIPLIPIYLRKGMQDALNKGSK